MFSPTHGKVTQEKMIELIHQYITSGEKGDEYDITVGADSQSFKTHTKFVLVVAVHRIGCGGIFFYHVEHKEKTRNVQTKIHTEVQMSIEMASMLNQAVMQWDLANVNFSHIDIDIGKNGLTKEYIKEVVGWVNGVLGGEGIHARIKPNAPTASCIADKISK